MKPLQPIKKSRNAPADGPLKRVLGCALALGVAVTVGAATTNELLRASPDTERTGSASLRTNVQIVIGVLEQQDVHFDPSERTALAALHRSGSTATEATMEQLLAPHTLVDVHINPEMRVKVNAGAAPAELVIGEWQFFLVRIQNDSGTTAPLQISVINPEPWLAAEVVATTNLPLVLSGAALEYRVVKLRSREAGKREARISFHVGQGTQDLGFRNEVDMLFDCRTKPSTAANQLQSSQP